MRSSKVHEPSPRCCGLFFSLLLLQLPTTSLCTSLFCSCFIEFRDANDDVDKEDSSDSYDNDGGGGDDDVDDDDYDDDIFLYIIY